MKLELLSDYDMLLMIEKGNDKIFNNIILLFYNI